MYLVARLIGIGTYALLLFLMYLIIRNTNTKSLSGFLKIYVVLLSVMAFFYVPSSGADLYRLVPIMHIYAGMSPEQLWSYIVASDTPGEPLYFYLVGQLGHDGFLPAISALITYSLCFSILNDCVKKTGTSVKNAAAVLLLFMSRGLFLSAISNIRTMMALALIGWCVYHEMVNGRNVLKNVLLYLFAASLHVMGQVFLVVRIAFLLLEKTKNVRRRFLKIVIAVVAAAVVAAIAGRYLETLIETGMSYYEGGRSGEGYVYFWEGLLSGAVILFTVGFLLSLRKRKTAIEVGSVSGEGLARFSVVTVAINIAALFFEFNFFHRTGMLLAIFNIPLGLFVLESAESEKEQAQIRSGLLILSVVMLFVTCARGDLCSLKFFE